MSRAVERTAGLQGRRAQREGPKSRADRATRQRCGPATRPKLFLQRWRPRAPRASAARDPLPSPAWARGREAARRNGSTTTATRWRCRARVVPTTGRPRPAAARQGAQRRGLGRRCGPPTPPATAAHRGWALAREGTTRVASPTYCVRKKKELRGWWWSGDEQPRRRPGRPTCRPPGRPARRLPGRQSRWQPGHPSRLPWERRHRRRREKVRLARRRAVPTARPCRSPTRARAGGRTAPRAVGAKFAGDRPVACGTGGRNNGNSPTAWPSPTPEAQRPVCGRAPGA